MKTLSATLLFTLLTYPWIASHCLAGEHWPDYRGPDLNGQVETTDLPLKWDEKTNVKWKTAIHGRAWASPVVWGHQVWVTTASEDGKALSALCIDATNGKILFEKIIFHHKTVRDLGNAVNSHGSPSPVIEDGHVYVHWGSYGTACIDTKTFKVLWERRDLPCNHYRGPASSPVLYKDLLILTFDGSDHQYLAGLNKKTGATVWKTDRSTEWTDIQPDGSITGDGDYRKSFATPLLIHAAGKDQLISPGAKAGFSYDPATGKEIWTVTYKQHSSASRTVYADGFCYINTGYGKPVLLKVPVDGTGDVTGKIDWTNTKNLPKRSSPILHKGRLFTVDDGGIACCINTKTGDYIWRERLKGHFSASILMAENRLYLFDEKGHAYVIAPKDTFELLATNSLDGSFMASPAVAGNAFYLRTKTHLYKIEK